MPDQPFSNIKQLRERAGLSQTQLAFLVGVSVDTIANWENGRRGLDGLERFVRLCVALGCQAEDLIRYTQDPAHSHTSHEQTEKEIIDQLKKKVFRSPEDFERIEDLVKKIFE